MTSPSYTLPDTPSGRSSLVTAPPWHFSGECLALEFTTQARAVRDLLPTPLVPEPEGHGLAVFCEWQSCSDDRNELADPIRSQFKEFFVIVAATLEGEPVAYCPFMWVDKSFSIVRGWMQGLPKKHGSIWMSRPTSVGQGGPRLAPGSVFAGTASADDQRLAEGSVLLESEAVAGPALFARRLVARQLIPDWTGSGDRIDRLVASRVENPEWGTIWTGLGSLEMRGSVTNELSVLAPAETGRGWWFTYGETLRSGIALDA